MDFAAQQGRTSDTFFFTLMVPARVGTARGRRNRCPIRGGAGMPCTGLWLMPSIGSASALSEIDRKFIRQRARWSLGAA